MSAAPATAAASAPGSALLEAGRYIAQSFRLMVGQPSYDTYVAHRQRT
ncbi:MAG: YbdD/YjiX family protein, partial [Curvibacter sp.]